MAEPAAILITGPDDYLLSTKVKEVLAALVPEADRMFGLETVDCSVDTVDTASRALSQTRNALMQQGFFSDRKTVWMRDVSFLDSKRLQKSETMNKEIEGFCDWLLDPGIPPGVILLVTSTSVPKTSRFYKTFAALSKSGKAELLLLPAPSAKEASNVVLDLAQKLNYRIPKLAVDEIIARVGFSPRDLMMEIEKLYLYTKGAAPTVADVENICTMNAGGEFWDLTTAFGNHDLAKTIKVLRNLYEMRVEPIFLVMQIEARLNELFLICDSLASRKLADNGNWCAPLSPEDAVAVGGLGKYNISAKTPWALGSLMSQARKWNVTNIKHARTVMINAHERMVSVSVDAKALLELAMTDALNEA